MQGYHQFFDVPRDNAKIQRTKVVCAFCGQVRVLWVSGDIEIIRQTGRIVDIESPISTV